MVNHSHLAMLLKVFQSTILSLFSFYFDQNTLCQFLIGASRYLNCSQHYEHVTFPKVIVSYLAKHLTESGVNDVIQVSGAFLDVPSVFSVIHRLSPTTSSSRPTPSSPSWASTTPTSPASDASSGWCPSKR